MLYNSLISKFTNLYSECGILFAYFEINNIYYIINNIYYIYISYNVKLAHIFAYTHLKREIYVIFYSIVCNHNSLECMHSYVYKEYRIYISILIYVCYIVKI